MRWIRRSAVIAMLLLIVFPASAASDETDPSLVLWYEQPASAWTEALPVGNGELGAMVFGRVEHERIQLNVDTLWAGSPIDRVKAGAHGGRQADPVRAARCHACGDCVAACPEHAIRLERLSRSV